MFQLSNTITFIQLFAKAEKLILASKDKILVKDINFIAKNFLAPDQTISQVQNGFLTRTDYL